MARDRTDVDAPPGPRLGARLLGIARWVPLLAALVLGVLLVAGLTTTTRVTLYESSPVFAEQSEQEKREEGREVTGWEYEPDHQVDCASVLAGPVIEPDRRDELRELLEDEERYPPPDARDLDYTLEDDTSRMESSSYGLGSDWATTLCDRVRGQRIGRAVLQGAGLAVALAVGVMIWAAPGRRAGRDE